MDIKTQTMLQVLKMQRDQALDIIVELNGKLAEMDEELQKLKQPTEEVKP